MPLITRRESAAAPSPAVPMPAPYERLAARLPFHLDDIERANAAFCAFRAAPGPATRRVVDLWTYCYVSRYFRTKFARETAYAVADVDLLVEKAQARIWAKRHTVRQPERYASWVSVVCKRTFLNWIRSRRRIVSIETPSAPPLVAEPGRPLETVPVRAAVRAAVDRLPPFLREVARLRFVEGASYAAIAGALQKPAPVVRAYAFKARTRLRKDPLLRDLFGLGGPSDSSA